MTINKLDWDGQPAIMTVKETSRFFRSGEACVRNMCRIPGFPAMRIGGRAWRISRDGLKRWIEAQTEGRGSNV